jgi:hypothetical protein
MGPSRTRSPGVCTGDRAQAARRTAAPVPCDRSLLRLRPLATSPDQFVELVRICRRLAAPAWKRIYTPSGCLRGVLETGDERSLARAVMLSVTPATELLSVRKDFLARANHSACRPSPQRSTWPPCGSMSIRRGSSRVLRCVVPPRLHPPRTARSAARRGRRRSRRSREPAPHRNASSPFPGDACPADLPPDRRRVAARRRS